jgi:hypothetical protein
VSPEDRWRSAREVLGIDVLKDLIASAENVIDPGESIAARLAYKVGALLTYPFYLAFGNLVAETLALADAEGLPRRKVMILQRLYTLAYLDPFGCSTCVVEHVDTARKLHFRTLDWPMLRAMRESAQIHAFQWDNGDKSFGYESAGMYGMVGLLSAAKPGFSVTINYAPKRFAASMNNDPLLMLRRVFDDEKIRSYVDAVSALSGSNDKIGIAGAPVFFTIAGCGKGEACVIELGAPHERPNRIDIATQTPTAIDGYRILVQTNHYEDDVLRGGQRDLAAHNKPAWVYGAEECMSYATPLNNSSAERKRLLRNGLEQAIRTGCLRFERAAGTWQTKGLWDVYSQPPLYNFETAQWVQLDPLEGKVRMWVRAPEALNAIKRDAVRKCFEIGSTSNGRGSHHAS